MFLMVVLCLIQVPSSFRSTSITWMWTSKYGIWGSSCDAAGSLAQRGGADPSEQVLTLGRQMAAGS